MQAHDPPPPPAAPAAGAPDAGARGATAAGTAPGHGSAARGPTGEEGAGAGTAHGHAARAGAAGGTAAAAPARPTFPDTLVLFLGLALLAWASTFAFAPGRFAVAGDPPRLVPGSFTTAGRPDPAPLLGEDGRVGFLDIPYAGLASGTLGLAAFLLVVGGAFGLVMRTGSIDRTLAAALARAGGASDGLLVLLFLAFSLAGAVFGMSEEAIAFTLILVPALCRAGYDRLTGLLVGFGATQVGFATSWMNPFNVIVAQEIAGLPPLSGLGFRLGLWGIFTAVSAAWVWRYARRIRQSPALLPAGRAGGSPTAEDEAEDEARAAGRPVVGDWVILVLLLAALVWVGWGVIARQWYLAELSAAFLALALSVAAVSVAGGLAGANRLAAAFAEGAARMAPVILVIGLARGILQLLGGDDPARPSLLNTLLDGLSALVAGLPPGMTAAAMLAVQSAFNLLVPSGSGQAAITMPVMAPLADLAGVSRQVAVLAFQLGDGLTNLVVPTSAVLLGCLAAARVELGLWLRFIWQPVAGLLLLALAAVLLASAIGFA